jgi:glycosyltransferase involved in cell wall biosynthesis
VLKPEAWAEDNLPPVAVWGPVDHNPLPPACRKVYEQAGIVSLAPSLFGEQMMLDAGLEPTYIPHAVDTSLFRPMREHRDIIRDQLNLPRDAFVAGMVAANLSSPMLPRKSFPQVFQAFTRFAKDYADAWLYVHTDWTPVGAGMNLNTVADLCGLPGGRVRYPDARSLQIGLPPEVVAYTYQAFDVLLSPSMGEGFGIPILEAQACGVPVIVSDHSSMPELCHAGWLVTGDPWLDYGQEAWFFNPSVDSIVEALELAYQAREDQELRTRAVEFAQFYDADQVADRYWQPALAQLGEPLEVVA